MDNRKKLGLLIIIIGLLIVAAIVYFIFIRKPVEVPAPSDLTGTTTQELPGLETSDTTPGDRPVNNRKLDISTEKPHQTGAGDVAKLASSFAERLGSFSNQSNYSNFDDLSIFMTETMRAWAKDYVETTKRENPYNGSYYGITTMAISSEVKNFDDAKGSAEVVIGTERRETKVDGSENNYNQDLRLVFIKQNGQWLVDGAYWLK